MTSNMSAEVLDAGPGKMDRTYPAVRDFLDRHVLQYMVDCAPDGYDFYGFPLQCFTNEWITKDMVRAICRNLTDRGFAQFHRGGLFDEDGMTAGSGYSVTDKGREHLKLLYAAEDAAR